MDVNKRNFKKRINWTHDEVKILLYIWKEKKDELKFNKRNLSVILQIQKELKLSGIDCTVDEIKSKMHNLKTKYKNEKKVIDSSGGSPEWPMFDDMKELFGNTKSINSSESMEESFSVYLPTTNLSSPEPISQTLSYSSPLASPVPSTSTPPSAASSTGRKKLKRNNDNIEVLNRIDSGISTVEQFIKNSEEVDKQMLENEKQLILLEERKTKIFEKMCEENIKFNELLLKKF